MTDLEVFLVFGGTAFGIIVSVAAYFIKMWIQEVDGTLKEHGKDIKAISKQISSLEQAQATQTKNISETLRKELTPVRVPYERLDSLGEEIGQIKILMKERVLPQVERQNDNLGKVVLLEKHLQENENKIMKLFEIVKTIALRKH